MVKKSLVDEFSKGGLHKWRATVDMAAAVVSGDAGALKGSESRRRKVMDLVKGFSEQRDTAFKWLEDSDSVAFFFNGNMESEFYKHIVAVSMEDGDLVDIGDTFPGKSPAGDSRDLVCVAKADSREEVVDAIRVTLYNLGG
jgi:hypothetical protein